MTMSTSDLIAHARRYAALKAGIRPLEEAADTERKLVAAEFARREATQIVHDGVQVTLKDRRVGYDLEAAEARLSPGRIRRLVKRVLDPKKVEAERKAGRLTADDVDAIELRSSPWPVVTELADQRDAA